MEYTPRPLLQAIIRAAVEGTAAGAGWIASVVDGKELAVVAAAAADPAMIDAMLWQRTPIGSGSASMVVQSGQPIALVPMAGSNADPWATALLGRDPTAIVCVPCHNDDQPLGALQLVDKRGGGAFSFDDVELVTLIAQIAGVALAEGAGAASRVPSPAQLSSDLGRLAEVDPVQYAAIAQVMTALLAQA